MSSTRPPKVINFRALFVRQRCLAEYKSATQLSCVGRVLFSDRVIFALVFTRSCDACKPALWGLHSGLPELSSGYPRGQSGLDSSKKKKRLLACQACIFVPGPAWIRVKKTCLLFWSARPVFSCLYSGLPGWWWCVEG